MTRTMKDVPAVRRCPICKGRFNRRENERPAEFRNRRTCGSAKCQQMVSTGRHAAWTPAEENVLRRIYPKFGARPCSEILRRRTLSAIKQRAADMGLRTQAQLHPDPAQRTIDISGPRIEQAPTPEEIRARLLDIDAARLAKAGT